MQYAGVSARVSVSRSLIDSSNLDHGTKNTAFLQRLPARLLRPACTSTLTDANDPTLLFQCKWTDNRLARGYSLIWNRSIANW